MGRVLVLEVSSLENTSALSCLVEMMSHLWQVRCLMCSPDEMGKLTPIIQDCTCVRSIVIMDR